MGRQRWADCWLEKAQRHACSRDVLKRRPSGRVRAAQPKEGGSGRVPHSDSERRAASLPPAGCEYPAKRPDPHLGDGPIRWSWHALGPQLLGARHAALGLHAGTTGKARVSLAGCASQGSCADSRRQMTSCYTDEEDGRRLCPPYVGTHGQPPVCEETRGHDLDCGSMGPPCWTARQLRFLYAGWLEKGWRPVSLERTKQGC